MQPTSIDILSDLRLEKCELCSFSKLSFASPTSQLILQPFYRFTYTTAHSPTLPLPHLHHSSFFKPSFASPTSQALHLCHLVSCPCFLEYPWSAAILQAFLCFTLLHSSFSNPSAALPTSQLILQPFCCFTYVIAHSPTLLSLLLCHRLFTYVTWRATHARKDDSRIMCTPEMTMSFSKLKEILAQRSVLAHSVTVAVLFISAEASEP